MPHSYSALEQEIHHRLRNDLNHAEVVHDVDNAFAFAVRTLLVMALNDSLRFTDRDIQLLPTDPHQYRLTDVITSQEPFKAAVADTDLLSIIARFAEQSAHRHTTLHHHADKIPTRKHKDH